MENKVAKIKKEPVVNEKSIERVLDLGNGIAVYKVHIDCLREQDKNAQVMPIKRFERLSENIKKDKRMESMPLCALPNNHNELPIISGHHRIRACRSVGVLYIYVLVIEENLSADQVKAKQLAHNALSGHSDTQLLKEIYEGMSSLESKLESGIFEEDLKLDAKVKIDEIGVDFDYQNIHMLFFPDQKKTFDNVIKAIEDDATIQVIDLKYFETFRKVIQTTLKNENVRSASGIILKMCEIVAEYYNLETNGGEGFNKRISVRVDANTNEAWKEWQDRCQSLLGYNNPAKCLEFAITEALNIPVESLK